MKILVLNSGSSSIKYQLFSMPVEKVLCSGLVERIGQTHARIKHNCNGKNNQKEEAIGDHKEALQMILDLLMSAEYGFVSSVDDIEAVGHRIVHGGHVFQETVELTNDVQSRIKEFSSLAPLHNPANLEGIKVAESVFGQAIQVGVFDTAFHQSIPQKAFKYAIPNKFLDEHHIRLYGFHGTSHKYVSEKASDFIASVDSKIITIHLGNGCSITAVKNGKSIDHSLGFSPVTGLIMGTRSGDIDHSLVFYLVNNLGYSLDDVDKLLQTKSGLLGLTGYSDLRDIEKAASEGDINCKLAIDMTVYRIKKYIGSYTAAMNGLDCIVFTAGIGENSELMRKMVCSEMEYFGIELDQLKNIQVANGISDLSKDQSKVKILVIPTNEELEIAKQTYQLYLNKRC
ncbi:MAG: acetate kinase [Bacteroidota bacterium]